jgi:GH15 family glucan-1,4-alpha-glucosidase
MTRWSSRQVDRIGDAPAPVVVRCSAVDDHVPPMRIEDFGLIGGLQSAALVGRNRSIRLALPARFDSASCFTVLLGDESHGRWLVAPSVEVTGSSRRYRPAFWLVSALDLSGRVGEARALFEAAPRVDQRRRSAAPGRQGACPGG